MSDPDPVVPSKPATEPVSSITEEREASIAGLTETIRGSPLVINHRSYRPPLLLDTAICVLLVLVVALLCRRVLDDLLDALVYLNFAQLGKFLDQELSVCKLNGMIEPCLKSG
ncbi:hypothetical protein J3R82DRAFT_5592 [Butyriboletus roseoflavus]|nr:hypothetical protein J3R82DRAFT_5592 [Butyriboletus roseoflavus]